MFAWLQEHLFDFFCGHCCCKPSRFRSWKAKYLPCPTTVVLVCRHMLFGESMLALISRPCLRLQRMSNIVSSFEPNCRKSTGSIVVESKTSAQTVAGHFQTWEADWTLASHAYEHVPATHAHFIDTKIVMHRTIYRRAFQVRTPHQEFWCFVHLWNCNVVLGCPHDPRSKACKACTPWMLWMLCIFLPHSNQAVLRSNLWSRHPFCDEASRGCTPNMHWNEDEVDLKLTDWPAEWDSQLCTEAILFSYMKKT